MAESKNTTISKIPKGFCQCGCGKIEELKAEIDQLKENLDKWETGRKLFMDDSFGDSIPELIDFLRQENERLKTALADERAKSKHERLSHESDELRLLKEQVQVQSDTISRLMDENRSLRLRDDLRKCQTSGEIG